MTLLGGRQRRFRALPIGRRAVWILLQFPRLECKACGAVRQAEVSFAPERHGYRKRFGRYAAELARHMTIRVPMLVVGLSLGGMQGVAVAVVRSKLGGRMVGRYFLRRLIHVSELDVIRTVGPAAIGAGLVLAGGWLIHTVIGGPETVPGLALVGALVFVPPAAITYRELKPELAALGGQIRPRAAP